MGMGVDKAKPQIVSLGGKGVRGLGGAVVGKILFAFWSYNADRLERLGPFYPPSAAVPGFPRVERTATRRDWLRSPVRHRPPPN